MQLRFFKIYRENKLLLIFLISSFIISLINFNIQTNFFGKYLLNNDGSSYHGILRSPPEVRMWKEAYKFKNDTNLKIIKDNEFKYHLLPSLNLGFIAKIFNIISESEEVFKCRKSCFKISSLSCLAFTILPLCTKTIP